MKAVGVNDLMMNIRVRLHFHLAVVDQEVGVEMEEVVVVDGGLLVVVKRRREGMEMWDMFMHEWLW